MALSKSDVDSLADATVREIRRLPIRNTPSIRAIRRKLSSTLRSIDAREVVAVAEALLARNLRWVGYEIITKHRTALASLRLKRVESLGKGIDSWSAVDTFALYISGPAWRDGQIATADIVRWAKSKDVWWRRAALVSTVPLNSKATEGDRKRTLKVAMLLIDDRDEMVVKAMSWALRALSTVQPATVRKFLSDNEGRLAARVKRETRSKLETGLKYKKKHSRT